MTLLTSNSLSKAWVFWMDQYLIFSHCIFYLLNYWSVFQIWVKVPYILHYLILSRRTMLWSPAQSLEDVLYVLSHPCHGADGVHAKCGGRHSECHHGQRLHGLAGLIALWLLYTLNLTNIGEMNSHYVISLKSDVGGYRDTEDKSQSHVSPSQRLRDHPHAGMSTVHLNCLPIQRQHSLTGWIWVSRGWLSTQ